MNSSLIKILDLIFLTRPVILIPVWGFCIFGMYSFKSQYLIEISSAQALLTLLFSLSVASVYVINQIADIDVDRENEGFALLVRGTISLNSAYGLCLILASVSVITPLLINQYELSALSALSIILGYFYSCKPSRFSGRPFLDFFSNAFGYGIIAFAAGWHIAGGELLSRDLAASALPYFLLMCAGSISSTLPDIPGDQENGKITTAVYIGKKNAHLLALFFLLFAAAYSLNHHEYLPFFCATISLPIYFLYLVFPVKTVMELTYKAGGTICMIAAAVAAPALIGAALFVFFSTWLYFRKRHGIVYPSLVPVVIDE